MASLGEYLRQERERRGVSVEEIARVTRVRRQYLEALEADRVADLPAAPFVRGFLQAYARHLGLPADDVLARFKGASSSALPGAPSPSPARGPSPSPARESSVATPGSFPARPRHDAPPGSSPAGASPGAPHAESRAPRYHGVLVLAGLVGVGAVAVLGSMVARPSAPARHVVPPVPVTTPVLVVVPGAPVASVPEEPVVVAPPALPTVPSALPAAPSPSPAGALPGAPHSSTLTIVATEQAWVQVVVDGAAPVEATLRPGERAAWQGRSFDIVVGNAGGVTLDLDGVPQPPLGESGRRAALTLPRR